MFRGNLGNPVFQCSQPSCRPSPMWFFTRSMMQSVESKYCLGPGTPNILSDVPCPPTFRVTDTVTPGLPFGPGPVWVPKPFWGPVPQKPERKRAQRWAAYPKKPQKKHSGVRKVGGLSRGDSSCNDPEIKAARYLFRSKTFCASPPLFYLNNGKHR